MPSPEQDPLMEKGALQHYETQYTKKDGSIIDVEINLSLLKDTAGRNTGSVVAVRDITVRKHMEEEIKRGREELEKKVAERTANLEEVNTALRVLLKRREEDKSALEDKVLINVSRLITPSLQKLKEGGLDERQRLYLELLENNLRDIISPFLQALSLKHLQLTPMEVEVANFIKNGRNSKQIAEILEVSRKTVEFHRDNIRRKADIKNKKINLQTYLMSLQ
jgi:DNA-binding CsgD family transcriptional regulator